MTSNDEARKILASEAERTRQIAEHDDNPSNSLDRGLETIGDFFSVMKDNLGSPFGDIQDKLQEFFEAPEQDPVVKAVPMEYEDSQPTQSESAEVDSGYEM